MLAQLSFLTQGLAVGTTVLCRAMAVLQHCFWLMAFCWMNVFAVDVCATFVRVYRSSSPQSQHRMRWYDAYAWLLPVLFVAACVATEQVAGLLQYGGATCWISPALALLYVFGFPLLLILLANSACFIATLVAIKRTNKLAKAAVGRSSAEEKKMMVVTSVKLSLVMGLTWISGFLANIPSLSFLWYVFIVLNTLQGVLIAISFVGNANVWKHYKMFSQTGSRFTKFSSATNTTNVSKKRVTSISKGEVCEEQAEKGSNQSSSSQHNNSNNTHIENTHDVDITQPNLKTSDEPPTDANGSEPPADANGSEPPTDANGSEPPTDANGSEPPTDANGSEPLTNKNKI
jgi:hypothetical protein